MRIVGRGARHAVGAVLALGLLVALVWVVLDPPRSVVGPGGSETTVSGVARLGPGEKRTSVLSSTIGDDAAAVAQFARSAPAGLRVRAEVRARGVVLILNKRAPTAVHVTWVVSGATDPEGSGMGAEVTPVVGLTVAGGGLFLAAYLLTHISASGSILFAAFAKVFGLLLVSGIGLIGAILASRADDAETFTALFTLLGLVAGYIAGTRTEPQTEGGQASSVDDDDKTDHRAEAALSTGSGTSTARSLL